jgi:hypothetical protein
LEQVVLAHMPAPAAPGIKPNSAQGSPGTAIPHRPEAGACWSACSKRQARA